MNNRLDDRIKELYAELTDAAPELPPLSAPEPARRSLWKRPVALAAAGAAALVVVVGVGVAVLTQLDIGDSDDTAAVAPPVTGAPAATVAPSPGETADTAAAAAEAPDDPAAQRPTDRILFLADLNRACASASEALASDLPTEPSSHAEYVVAFDLVANQIGPVRELVVVPVADQLDDPTLTAIAAQSLAVLQILEQGPGDDVEVAAERLAAALREVRTLGVLLDAFGAQDCAELGTDLRETSPSLRSRRFASQTPAPGLSTDSRLRPPDSGPVDHRGSSGLVGSDA